RGARHSRSRRRIPGSRTRRTDRAPGCTADRCSRGGSDPSNQHAHVHLDEVLAIDDVVSLADWGAIHLDNRTIVQLRDGRHGATRAYLYLLGVGLGRAAEPRLGRADDLELLRVELVEKRDRHTHDPLPVLGDVDGPRHLDGVVVVVTRVLLRAVLLN